MTERHRTTPLDADSEAALREQHLRYGLVDTADPRAFGAWLAADARGFHQPRQAAAPHDAELAGLADRRTTGVWDESLDAAEVPIATVASWETALTVSPGHTAPVWAISSVTVSPTHRRRGVARALLEGELRAAHAAGLPLAALTVTEATIYGRYGFSPAAFATTVSVERARARWVGPIEPGRVQFVEPSVLRTEIDELTTRAVLRTAGEVPRWPLAYDEMLGLVEPEAGRSRGVRAVRYDDASGAAQGYAIYRIERTPPAWGRLEVEQLVAATDEAERGLWRFLVGQDFVERIVLPLRSLEEPLPWLLEDPRAVLIERPTDHLWIRVLDPLAALGARRYGTSGAIVLDVDDPMGFARSRVRLTVDEAGTPSVEAVPETDTRGPLLRLGVRELGSILIGGVRPSVLAAAGRIDAGADGGGILALTDRMFAQARPPLLSFWF